MDSDEETDELADEQDAEYFPYKNKTVSPLRVLQRSTVLLEARL